MSSELQSRPPFVMADWWEEHARQRARQRAYRKEVTSMDMNDAITTYVFDEEAFKKTNDQTKDFIKEATMGGYFILVESCDPSAYLSPMVWSACERALTDVRQLFPGNFDLTTPLFAYLVACSNLLATTHVMFVSGNQEMLKILVEEATREELHDAVRARGLSGVDHYGLVDDDGKMEPLILKWDDFHRPSDSRGVPLWQHIEAGRRGEDAFP